MKKIISITITIILLISVIGFTLKMFNEKLISIDNRQSVLNAISICENKRLENSLFLNYIGYMGKSTDDVNSIEFIAIEKDRYTAIFYENRNMNNIIVLEKSKLFPSKYKYLGSSSTSSSFSVYKYSNKKNSCTLSVIAIGIREYEDYSGETEYCISKITDNGEMNTVNVVNKEKFNKPPYYNLFVQNYKTEDDLSFECSFE